MAMACSESAAKFEIKIAMTSSFISSSPTVFFPYKHGEKQHEEHISVLMRTISNDIPQITLK
jgi:hypothetical protein